MGVFALSLIGYKKYQHTTLYALAIGGVVNANYFNGISTPIECFGLPFGIDSMIYTLFVFCVMVVLLQDGKKSAYLITVSSIIAIVFSAVMELIAKLFTYGSSVEIWCSFLTFMISAFASIVAVFITIEIIHRVKKNHSPYLCMTLGIGLVTLLDSVIYYPLVSLVSYTENLWLCAMASLMGKAIALIYSLITLKLLFMLKSKTKA